LVIVPINQLLIRALAAVNFITKGGSNTYHGELFEYFRNNNLDANSYLNNEAGRKLQPYTQNQFGGAAGGPVMRNKLLFFGNYEGFRVVQREQQFAVVPDEKPNACAACSGGVHHSR